MSKTLGMLALFLGLSACGDSPTEEEKHPYRRTLNVLVDPDEQVQSVTEGAVVTKLPDGRFRIHHLSYRADGNVYRTTVTEVRIGRNP